MRSIPSRPSVPAGVAPEEPSRAPRHPPDRDPPTLRGRRVVPPSSFALFAALAFALAAGLVGAQGAGAQDGAPNGEWRNWGGDAGNTRYSDLDQIHAGNFGDLEVAWRWTARNFGPSPDFIYRATATYANGTLYTLAGTRRAVIAIEPATGETLWVWRMPDNPRWEKSPRQNYGKHVTYDEVDGQGRIFVSTPGFWLVALDAETGRPVEGWGAEGTGIVDLKADVVDEPVPDPTYGFDPVAEGGITSSAQPLVVNGVVVVPSTGEQGYFQYWKENIPSNILGYDARTGELLWRFHVIPRPGEYGHETWENGSWEYTGNVGSWAPISADPELGIVYIVTKAGTNDYYGGHRLGDGLFGTSIIALDARTGERVWHYQLVRHDVWNYDTPHAPQLVDVTVDGRAVPAVVVVTKQSFAYAFDRATGEPIWPFEYREVPASDVPGERLSPVQPFPTLPAPFEMQGIGEDDLVDFTPELREMALELMSQFRMGPLFNPPALADEEEGIVASVHCPGANGGANIPGGAAVDPVSGILYVASIKGCSAPRLLPGTEFDPDSNMRYATRGPGGIGTVAGIPVWKPPYGRITAIDLNTGETLWWIPNGDTPEDIRNHPLLEGVDVGRTGQRSHATVLLTPTLLMYGEGRGGEPNLRAIDKRTGEELARIRIPAQTTTAPMTFLHEGKQYIVLSVAGPGIPAELVALTLPD